MSERWIVGVDGSFGSRAALEWALRQSERRGAELVVVHAYGTTLPARVRALVGAADERESGAAATALTELDASISDLVADRRVERLVADRPPGKALVEAATDADLIVVGRHGAGGGWHNVVGSVSRYCVTHSSVPTVVVPTDWDNDNLDRIVVGFDGSDNSADAVRWATDFAPADAEVRAIIAIEIAPWLQSEIVAVRLEAELQAEDQRLRGLLDEVDPHGLATREIVVRGARPALARAAETADLVVLGQQGAGTVSSLLVGSVSTWMLDVAASPIAVIPHTVSTTS